MHPRSPPQPKSDRTKVTDLPEFDMAQYLGTDEDVAEYLRQVLEDGEPGELAAALGHIAKARGMTEIAKASGIKREALYKALQLAEAASYAGQSDWRLPNTRCARVR